MSTAMSVSARGRMLIGGVSVAAVLALWAVATPWGWVDAQTFPSPKQFGSAAGQVLWGEGYADGMLVQHLLHSLKLIVLGFAAASGVGVPLGLWMGWSRRAEAFVNPIFMLIRPIPALAWIPLAIVWLGLDDASKVMIMWFAAFVPSVINSYSGVRTIEPQLIEASRMLGIGRRALITDVIVPGALPSIFTGLRLSLQGCLTALVAAELLGAVLGLGKVLYQAGLDIYPAMILVGMVSVGIVGFLLTLLLTLAERLSMPWRRAD